MDQYWGFIRRILSGLALIATLGVAMLPDGQLPRIAGPCGRALCNCPQELVRPPAGMACSNCKLVKQAPRVLTLGSSIFTNVDDPGLAFQFAIDSGLPLARVATPCIHSEIQPASGVSRAFALKSAPFDIPTPPPRA